MVEILIPKTIGVTDKLIDCGINQAVENNRLLGIIRKDPTIKEAIEKSLVEYKYKIRFFHSLIPDPSYVQIAVFDEKKEFFESVDSADRHQMEFEQFSQLFESGELPEYLNNIVLQKIAGKPSELAEEFMDFLNKG